IQPHAALLLGDAGPPRVGVFSESRLVRRSGLMCSKRLSLRHSVASTSIRLGRQDVDVETRDKTGFSESVLMVSESVLMVSDDGQ
ncbi:hypothetical protein QTP70_012507, partial [Hemibagrus guttatus]